MTIMLNVMHVEGLTHLVKLTFIAKNVLLGVFVANVQAKELCLSDVILNLVQSVENTL